MKLIEKIFYSQSEKHEFISQDGNWESTDISIYTPTRVGARFNKKPFAVKSWLDDPHDETCISSTRIAIDKARELIERYSHDGRHKDWARSV